VPVMTDGGLGLKEKITSGVLGWRIWQHERLKVL